MDVNVLFLLVLHCPFCCHADFAVLELKIEHYGASGGWHEVRGDALWDAMLAVIQGHPLQSANWGEARKEVDGLESLYLVLGANEYPRGMARVETRKIPLLGNVAWIPRGPSFMRDIKPENIEEELYQELRKRGFSLVISNSYSKVANNSNVQTIWINLALGLDSLTKRIDKQWMYGVRRARREGVEVVKASNDEDVAQFFRMCEQISQEKGFELPGSEPLMQRLLFSPQVAGEEMLLFLAKYEGKIGAGAFVARSGKHLHYFWGASDRELSRQRVGEAVQWAAIEWGIEQGCSRYDLEGIDQVNNPGVYAFKKKMGGEEVNLVGVERVPLNVRGKCALNLEKLLRRI